MLAKRSPIPSLGAVSEACSVNITLLSLLTVITSWCPDIRVHCKNIWVTSTIFWSSQLHACCVCDMLQTSRDASNLVESFRVVETLLLFVTLGSSCRNPSYLATLLPTITMQPRNSSRGKCVGSKEHQTLPEMLIYRLSAR